jgi:hypothetical protein
MCFFIFSFLGHDRDKDASVSSVSGLDWNHTNRTWLPNAPCMEYFTIYLFTFTPRISWNGP